MDFATSESEQPMLNVNGSDDPHYRYKMPPLETTIINCKGGLTLITNIDKVCTSIFRVAVDLKKFYSKSLGLTAQLVDEGLQIPGRFDTTVLQEKLQRYINKVVLCSKCKCPETLPVKKNKLRCAACGFEC